ncbi:DUF2550 family protein [Ornithinimicrobium ciconiae]|uniref:DUF2550 family protein n=1 Tax=Ornithinimicrobium ciconiae TaxID=2594265 RepID=A0A516GDS7_9MICO|nr:DUF2550 family protein [Ornithinimicrobium ciconiae]QDO89667.1 DUF2550 family protein [Ornithinimicrobium ciconiae]
MDAGVLVLIALAVLSAALVMGIGLLAFHHFAGSARSFPCAYRSGEHEDWSRGLLHYDTGRLDHYGRGGPFRQPLHKWQRSALDLGIAREENPAAFPWLNAPVIAVPCEYADTRFELALGLEHYTGLRSWLESVPPGWNANVA